MQSCHGQTCSLNNVVQLAIALGEQFQWNVEFGKRKTKDIINSAQNFFIIDLIESIASYQVIFSLYCLLLEGSHLFL